MQDRSATVICIAALASLLSALALCAPLVERLFAAAWQWYKFADYSNEGAVYLSKSTGLVYSGFLAAAFVVALIVNYFAQRLAVIRARNLSLLAMTLLVAAAIGYWLLGMSSLNVWRA